MAEKFSTLFWKVPSRCERERSCFFLVTQIISLGTWKYFVADWQKTRHFSQRSKLFVQKNNLPSFPRENAFHFSTLGEKSFRLLEKLLRKSTQFFFFVCRGHFGNFYQRFRLFLDLSLIVWASAEQFSTVFLKVHSGCGRVFLFFFDHSNFFSWNLIIFLSKVGQKSCGCFLKAAKNVRRRTIWYLFPEKMLFRFSNLSANLPDFEKNFSEKVLSFSFFVSRGHFDSFFPREIGS